MRVLLVNHFPLEGSGSGVYTKNIAKIMISLVLQLTLIAIINFTILQMMRWMST